MHPAKQTRRPLSRLPEARSRRTMQGPPASYQYLHRAAPMLPPDSWEKHQADLAAQHDRAIAGYPDYLVIECAEDLTRRTIDSQDKSERIWIQARRAALLRAIQNRNLTPNHKRQ